MRNARRTTAMGTALFLAIGGLTVGGAAASASAADATVLTAGDLISAVSSGQTSGATVTLGADIDLSTSSALAVSQTLTLDLDGYTLKTHGIVEGVGITFTIRDSDVDGDPTTSGHLISAVSGLWQAGIDVSGASLVVKSGGVSATGGIAAAGIGTGHNEPGGSVTIDGGTVTAASTSDGPGIGDGSGSSGTTVTISGGTVEADGGDQGAGIGASENDSAGTVSIDGGTVTATGGTSAAGIGGGAFGNGGTVTIGGGTVIASGESGIGGGYLGQGGSFGMTAGNVTATSTGSGAGVGSGGSSTVGPTVNVTGGTLVATAYESGAGIGGGSSGGGGTVTIAAGHVTASAGVNGTAIGAGYGGAGGSISIGERATVELHPYATSISAPVLGTSVFNGSFGAVTIAGHVILPAEAQLFVQTGGTLTVAATGVISGPGDVNGTGSIINHGTISVPTVQDGADPEHTGDGLSISDHDYLVTFDTNPPTTGDSAQFQTVRIYATSFAAANRAIATWGDQQGYIFTGWNSASGGTGNALATSTPFGGDQTYYGKWEPVAAIHVTGSATTVVAGHSLTFTLHGTDADGDTSNQTVYGQIYNVSGGAADSSGQLLFTHAGINNVDGELTVGAPNAAQLSTATDLPITVTPAALNTLALSPEVTAATVAIGTTQKYDLTGTDAYNNAISGLPAHTTIAVSAGDTASTNPTTGVVSVHFTALGTRTITATDGGVTTHITVTVVKDTPTILLTLPATWKHGKTTKVSLTLGAGASLVKPTGTVRVYYGSKYVSVTYKATTASKVSVTIPKLKKKSYAIHAAYQGSTTYATVATVTTTIKAK